MARDPSGSLAIWPRKSRRTHGVRSVRVGELSSRTCAAWVHDPLLWYQTTRDPLGSLVVWRPAALVRPGAALPQRSPRHPDWRAPPSVRRTAPRQAWPGFTTPSSGAKEQKPLLVEGPLSSVYRIARSIACGGLSPSRAHVARPSEACRPRGDGALPLSPCACAAGTLGYRSRRRLRGSPLPSS